MASSSLVDSLRPAARDQIKLADRTIRTAVQTTQFSNGSQVLTVDMGAYASFSIQFAGDSSSFMVIGSNDRRVWMPLDVKVLGGEIARTVRLKGFTLEGVFSGVAGSITTVVGNKQTRYLGIITRVLAASKNVSIFTTLSQTPIAPIYEFEAPVWNYAAASGGIVNTTAVTLQAAQSGHQLGLTQLEVGNGGTAGTEVTVSDGTPTVLWRGYLAAGQVLAPRFDPPLLAATNSAITAQLSVGTGVAVYANARGKTLLANV